VDLKDLLQPGSHQILKQLTELVETE